jgi:membrane protein
MSMGGVVAVGKDVVKQVQRDQMTDWAKVMTYQSIFALFPMLLLGVSILGFIGQGQLYADMLEQVEEVAPESLVQPISDFLANATTASGAGIAFVIGLLLALNGASGALAAAGKGLNVVLGVEDDRGFVRKKGGQVFWTLVLIVLISATLIMIFLGGNLASWVFDQIGLGDTAVTIWTYARWPAAALVLMLAWAIIYKVAPDGGNRAFRFISPGAVIGVLVWLAASLAFFVYVQNFGSYSEAYGAFATAIILLLWLWISNLALLIGAEINAVLDERKRGISHEPEGLAVAGQRSDKGADGAPGVVRGEAPRRRGGIAGGLALTALAFLALLPARRKGRGSA